jgi:hypothetical protein
MGFFGKFTSILTIITDFLLVGRKHKLWGKDKDIKDEIRRELERKKRGKK